MKIFALTVLFALFFTVSCTWVDVNEKGYQVTLISEERGQSCTRIGTTSSNVIDAIGPIPRSESKVQEELIGLARNEAGAMGGDAIAPQGNIVNGSQTFIVYQCN